MLKNFLNILEFFAIVAICVFVMVIFLVLGLSTPVHAEEIDLQKIAMIESSGNPLAHNKRDDSRGLFQITPVCLKDFNQFHKVKYTMDDLWSASVSAEIADWYLNKRIPQLLKHYGIADTVRNRLVAYNAGISTLVNNRPLPMITKNYLKKYGVTK